MKHQSAQRFTGTVSPSTEPESSPCKCLCGSIPLFSSFALELIEVQGGPAFCLALLFHRALSSQLQTVEQSTPWLEGFPWCSLTLSFRIKLVWAFIAQGIEQTNSNLNQSLKNRQGKCNLSWKPSATQLCPCLQHYRKKIWIPWNWIER